MRRLVLVLLLLLVLPASAEGPRSGFGWPLGGTPAVQRGFEPPTTAYGPGHRGVDLRAAAGDPVLAAGAGRVSYAGLLAGRGVVSIVHPGGLRTTYEPLIVTVRVGQLVAGGGLIGRLSTGHSSCHLGTTCLHWGLLRGQTYLDPLGLLGAARLRLLPVGKGAGAEAPAGPALLAPPQDAASTRAATRDSPHALSGPVRGVGAVAAVGSLLLGTALLAGRPVRTPSPPEPGGTAHPPVDLLAERRRRRAG